jgi:hypothetical protein
MFFMQLRSGSKVIHYVFGSILIIIGGSESKCKSSYKFNLRWSWKIKKEMENTMEYWTTPITRKASSVVGDIKSMFQISHAKPASESKKLMYSSYVLHWDEMVKRQRQKEIVISGFQLGWKMSERELLGFFHGWCFDLMANALTIHA